MNKQHPLYVIDLLSLLTIWMKVDEMYIDSQQ